MKRLTNTLVLITLALTFTACSHTPAALTARPAPTPEQPATQGPSAAPSQAIDTAAAAPVAVVSAAPLPLPSGVAEELIGSLLDPGLWQASLHISEKDYPRVDGSTATIPLGIFIRAKLTGETLAQSMAVTNFTKTGPAWLALANGRADLLVVYEAPDEIKQQMDVSGLIVKPAGLDALVFLTNKGNPVNSLTQEQIVDIYAGKIKKWSQVGGQNQAIIPYQRISNSGSQALMLKLVMKDVKIMDAPQVLTPGEMGELMNDVASYENTNNALGYSVYYYAHSMYQLPGVKLLAVDGVAPTPETIASGAYPYVSPFYVVIRASEPAGSPAHKMFDWLTGDEGKKAVQDAGYVPPK